MPSASLTRRTAVLALPVATSALLAGCRWGPDDAGNRVASGTTPPPRDADEALVERAVRAIDEASAVVAAAVAARPPLRGQLAGFSTLHEAHLRHLGAEPTATESDARARQLSGVLRIERNLQDTLVELAASAGSGQLARSLASMAAGVAQHLAVAPRVAS